MTEKQAFNIVCRNCIINPSDKNYEWLKMVAFAMYRYGYISGMNDAMLNENEE